MARFHLLSPVAFVLNVVLIPLVGLVLFCGFGTMISGLVFPLALSPFAWVCSQGIGLIEWLVGGAAALTWGHLYVPGPPAWWLAGFYGGFAAVVLLNYALGIRLEAALIVPLAALLPLAAVMGDLAESILKRGMQVKDAGSVIPGHGGFLDRLDSLLFTFPVVYYFLTWVVP